MTRAALLLALMLAVQSLRLIMPLPPFVSMFVIGALVNACLLISTEFAGWKLTLLSAAIAPIIAYLQQALPIPALVAPVAVANAVYISGYALMRPNRLWAGVVAATFAKGAVLWACVKFLLDWLDTPQALSVILQNMLGWAQLITGIAGGAICIVLVGKLKKTGAFK